NPKAEGGAEFVPELIHNRSGVGSQFVVTDLNGDGAPDVVISCVKGTFVFWYQVDARPQRSKRKPSTPNGDTIKPTPFRHLPTARANIALHTLTPQAQNSTGGR